MNSVFIFLSVVILQITTLALNIKLNIYDIHIEIVKLITQLYTHWVLQLVFRKLPTEEGISMRMSRVFDEILDSAFGADYNIRLTAKERSELLKIALQKTDPQDRDIWKMSNYDTLQVPIAMNPSDVIFTNECPIDWETCVESDDDDYYTIDPMDVVEVIYEVIPAYPQRILRGFSWCTESDVIRNLRAVAPEVIEYVD